MAKKKETSIDLKPIQKDTLYGAAQGVANLKKQRDQTMKEFAEQITNASGGYRRLAQMVLESKDIAAERLDQFHLDGDKLIYELKEDVGTEQDT